MIKKKKYIVKVTINYYDDGFLYDTKTECYDTYAISQRQAVNNVRYRTIGKKYPHVDHQPYSDRYTEVYDFEVDEW